VAADALMDFDDTNRVARGMIVTSRGFGYEAAPTVKVHQANCSDTWDCTVETVDFDAADFAHGGLTKRGAGTLTITCTNTYGGATRLEGGTLAFSHEHGYPGGDLEIAAAAVQGPLSAPLLTAHTLAFGAGKGVRVTEADILDEQTFGRFKTVATFTTPLAEPPSLTLVDGNGDELPPSGLWNLMLTDGGRTLKFGAVRGTQVIFR
jgi:autotransporter-associated beta strand protein